MLLRKPEGKRQHGKPRCRWEDSTIMDLVKIGWDRVDWMHPAQDRDQWRALVNTIIQFGFYKGGLCSMEFR
jgi:hypothetical protein